MEITGMMRLAMRLRGNKVRMFAVGLGVVLLALALAGRFLVDADRYRERAIAFVHDRTGKPAEIGRIWLTWFPLAVHVANFGLQNTPPFPAGYIVKVERIDAELDARELWHRRVVVKSLVLDGAEVRPTSDPDGPWNFEKAGAKTSDAGFAIGEIGKVQIKRGQLVASNLMPSNALEPIFFEAHNIAGEFDHVNVDAMLDPAASSMGGQGGVTADRMSFGAVDAKNLSFRLQLWAKQIFLGDLKADVYGGNASGAMFFDLTKERPGFRMNALFSGINVVNVLEPFENGRGKMSGQMDGDLTLAGEIQHTHRPLAGIRGSGHVTVKRGKVPSVAFNQDLMRLVHYNNLGPAKDNPSSFNRISTDLELANLRITSRTIEIDGYGVDVDASGSVNVDGSDEIDYQGMARITTKQGFFTNTFARFAGAKVKDGLLSFPFRVGGTIGAPAFAKGAR
jgi:uncharacterized protein involved in outer membrane biogenesis